MSTVILDNREVYAHLVQMARLGQSMSFDTWGLEIDAEAYYAIDKVKSTVVSIEGKTFSITHRKSGGMGMGSYPDCYRLTPVKQVSVIKLADGLL